MAEIPLVTTPLPYFGRAAQLLAEAHHRSETRAKACHERFNVFTTLLKADDEVRLHTRFLHALLDPHGLHDCGDLFLRLFFETLSSTPCYDHEKEPVKWQAPAATTDWTVKKEMGQTGGLGQIDLLLTHPTFAVAIENKINAKERKEQLFDYGRFLNQYRGQAILLYLTKDGRESTSHGGLPYLRISYVDHILPWLEACLRETYRMIPVNQILLQYREVVRQVTNKTLENPFMKPVIDYVSNNPDILRYRAEINAAADEAVALFLDRLAEAVIKDLNRDFRAELRGDMEGGRFGLDDEGDVFIQPASSSNLHGVPFQICLERDTEWQALLIGIYADDEIHALTAMDHARLKMMDEWLCEHSRTSDYQKEDANELWPVGWHNILEDLDDHGLANLLASDFEKLVVKICGDVRQYIKLVEAAYEAAKSKVG